MIRRFFALSIILCSLQVTAQKSDSSYTVKGEFSNLKSGTVYLTLYKESGPVKDSADLKDGKFKFEGYASEPVTAYLTKKDGNKND